MKSYSVNWGVPNEYGMKYYIDYFIPSSIVRNINRGYLDVSYVHSCSDTEQSVRTFLSTLNLEYIEVREIDPRKMYG